MFATFSILLLAIFALIFWIFRESKHIWLRAAVISLSRIGSSGGLGSATGSVIGSGSPATTTRASGPVGESWPWSYGMAASS